MMFFWPLFLIFGLVILVTWAARGGQGQLPMMGCMGGHAGMDHAAPEKSAMDVVRERYARGEINKEQFEEMSRALGS